jgi:hypothetical protein
VIAESPGAWKILFPRINLEDMSHKIRVVHPLLRARWPRSRANTYINRLLVMNITGAMAMFISFRLHPLTEPSAPSNSSTHRFPPRPWMVARDSSRIFPNIIDPFDWFIPSLLDELMHRAASTTSCVVAPRVVSSRPKAWHTSGDARIRSQQVRSVRPGPI